MGNKTITKVLHCHEPNPYLGHVQVKSSIIEEGKIDWTQDVTVELVKKKRKGGGAKKKTQVMKKEPRLSFFRRMFISYDMYSGDGEGTKEVTELCGLLVYNEMLEFDTTDDDEKVAEFCSELLDDDLRLMECIRDSIIPYACSFYRNEVDSDDEDDDDDDDDDDDSDDSDDSDSDDDVPAAKKGKEKKG